MGLSLGQVDEVLRSWRTRLSAVAENLLALQADTTYQSLTGTGGLDKVAVSGLTAARVGAVPGRMNGLFLQFGALQGWMEQAEALRRGLPVMFGGEAKLRELEGLLFGASIEVEAGEMPPGERTLVSGAAAARRVTAEQMLGAMTTTFAEVQAAVTAVGSAWAAFAAEYERAELAVARLEAQTAMPAAAMERALAEVKSRLQQLRAEVKTDPVGAQAGLRGSVEPALRAATAKVAAAETMAGRLRAARATWEAVQGLHAEAVRVAAAAGEKVTAVTGGEVAPAAKIQGLGEWLERLERRRDEQAAGAEAMELGLRNWSAAAEACLTGDRAAMAAWTTAVAARAEMRGRFDALKAKARAYGVAEQEEVAALGLAAEASLYCRPVDLRAAAAAVGRYEQRLRSDAGARPPGSAVSR